eukprot:Skav201259  [mRNA]  locus=scaffold1492:199943:201616:+ [translate_table: standard]
MYMSKLLLFPKKSGVKGVKKGDTPRSELQNVAQNTLKDIIPVPKMTKRVKARAITSEAPCPGLAGAQPGLPLLGEVD